jgi:hypothetical protein
MKKNKTKKKTETPKAGENKMLMDDQSEEESEDKITGVKRPEQQHHKQN